MDDVTLVDKPQSFSPAAASSDTLEQLRDLQGELGTQIGYSVVSRILASESLNPSRHTPYPSAIPPLEPLPSTLDMSQLNVVVISKWSATEVTIMRAAIHEPPTPAKISTTPASEVRALQRVLIMLENVLARSASPAQQSTQWTRSGSCCVCGERAHPTCDHCMNEKRCFGCLEPGHQKRDCTQPRQHQIQPESRTLNQEN